MPCSRTLRQLRGICCCVNSHPHDRNVWHCRRPPVLVLAVILIVVVLAGHAIHDGHKADGNPFVWLFGRLGFSIVLYLHPYYQVWPPRQHGDP